MIYTLRILLNERNVSTYRCVCFLSSPEQCSNTVMLSLSLRLDQKREWREFQCFGEEKGRKGMNGNGEEGRVERI
jgi:hypothetical protein